MNQPHILPARRSRVSICIVLAASMIGASGCAYMPNLGTAPSVKPVEQLSSTKTFADSSIAWPGDHWWENYGDPQLNSLVEEALRDSPDLELARARLHLAGAAVQGANAAMMPEVSGNASFTKAKQSYNYLMPQGAVPQNWNDYGQATLNLSWELDFWGKNRAVLASAMSNQKAAQAEVGETRLILSASVASAYAELLHLFTVRDTAEETFKLRTKTTELFRQRHQFGLENEASVNQVEARQAAAQTELRSVDERISLQRNAIAALLGEGPDRGLVISRPTVRSFGSMGLPANLALNLIGRRPDLVAARLRAEAAAKRIDQQKAAFYPSVNLLAFTGYQSLGIDNLTKSGSDFGSVGPAISLPIFNTERLQGQLRGARADYDAAVASYNGTLANALHEVADAVVSRKALVGELASSRASVDAANKAYSIMKKRYEGQLAGYLDVLSAEDELVAAKRSLADIETRALVLDVALVRALGGGFQSTDQLITNSKTSK